MHTTQSNNTKGTFNPEILPKFIFNTIHRTARRAIEISFAQRAVIRHGPPPKGSDAFRL